MEGYEFMDRDLAVVRIQGQARRLRSIRKVQIKRDQIKKEQGRAGRYIVWAGEFY